jgi:putative transposase
MLCEPENIELLRAAFKYVMDRHPFTIDAHVILPDHLHFMWTLPDEDRDFSTRWRLIKSYFTRNCDAHYKAELSKSRQKKKEQAVWQRRFWEHQIRDEQDMKHHIEYIHFNPVKHCLVKAAKDWGHSSFQKYVRAGLYDPDWGMSEPSQVGWVERM